MFIFLNKSKQVKRIKSILFILTVLISFSFTNSVFGWTAPTAIPPGNNIPTPLNVGTTEQTKEGSLIIIGSAIFSGGVDLSYGGVNESDITGADQIIGYNDLRLWGNTSETESIWIDSSGAKIVFKVNNAERMRINSSGYVGIATSTPAYTLDVAGDINLTGNLTVDGSPIATGYWSKSGTYVYYNDGNVGIGITTPLAKLHVYGGDILLANNEKIYARNAAGDGNISVYHLSTGNNQTIGDLTAGYLSLDAGSFVRLQSDGAELMRLTGGNVGIGITTPDTDYKLSLSGGGIKSESTSNPAGYFSSSSGYGLLVNLGNVGIGTLTPTYKLDVSGTFRASATSTFTGNVGIGTVTPAYKLEVVGNTNIQGDLTINGSPIATGYWSKSGSYVYYNDGNVGIGTTNPSDKLTVVGGNIAIGDGSATSTISNSTISNTGSLYIKPSGDIDDYLEFYTSGGFPSIKMVGTWESRFESDDVNNVRWKWYDDSTHYGWISYLKTLHNFEIHSTDAINIQPSGDTDDYLEFSTDSDIPHIKTVGTSNLHIEPDGGITAFTGSVGIGTDSPNKKLDIESTVAGDIVLGRFTNLNSAGGSSASIDFKVLDQYAQIKAIRTEANIGADLAFLTTQTGASSPFTPTEVMRITEGGKVGIATSTPAYTLDVAGDINLTGNLTQNGSAFTVGGLWTEGADNKIYYNAGNVGVGTLTPGAKLEIYTSDDDAVQYGLKINSNDNFQPSINYGVYSNANMTSYVNSNIYGGYFIGEMGRGTNSSGSQIGLVGEVKITDSVGSLTVNTETVGVKGIITVDSAGGDTVSEVNSFKAEGSVASGDTITSYKGYRVTDVTGAGTTTNSYGLYVDSLTKGSSNNYAVYTAGTTESYFGGNVGIGITSSANKLDVAGNIALGASYTSNVTRYIGIPNSGDFGVDGSTAIEFESVAVGGNYSQNMHFWTHHYGAGTGGSPRMTIRYDGNVGIGTVSPGAKLVISAGTGNPADTTWELTHNKFIVEMPSASYGEESQMLFDSPQNQIGAITGKFWGGNFNDGRLAFSTTDSGTLGVKMVIAGSGNVGIGTTEPSYRLDVDGNARITGPLASEASYNPSDDGLLLYVPFSEGSGATVSDKSKYGHELGMNGATWSSDGKFGYAGHFDGIDDYIGIESIDALSTLGDKFTVSAWFRTSISDGYRKTIVKQTGGTGSFNTTGWKFVLSETTFSFRVCDSSVVYSSSNCATIGLIDVTTNNDWHHMAGTWDPSTFTVTLYFDGELVGSATPIGTILTSTPHIADPSIGLSNYFNGDIDEVYIYERILSAEEIIALSGNTVPGLTTGSVVFVGSAGELAEDNSNFFWDNTDNRLGIGTASPTSKLEIQAGIIDLYGKAVVIEADIETNPSPYTQTLRLSGGDNNTGASLGFGHYGQAIIKSRYLGTDRSGILDFYTRNTTGVPTVKMTIMNTGNVGIGTSSPSSKLAVYGAGQLTANLTDAGNRGDTLELNSNTTSAGSGGALVFGNIQSQTANSIGMAAIKGYLTNGAGNTIGDLTFSTRNATGDIALTERMRILSGGNVGIGTTNPAYTLDVAGDARFTGNLIDSNSNSLNDLNYRKMSRGVPTLPEYKYIASLPADTSTADEVHVEIIGQSASGTVARSKYMFKRRGGFEYEWYYEGDEWTVNRFTVVCYELASGIVDIYIKNNASYSYGSVRVILQRAMKTSGGAQISTILGQESLDAAWSATVPTGTKIFDASDLGIYPANMLKSLGSIKLSNKLTVPTIDPQYDINGNTYGYYISDYAGGVRMNVTGKAELKKSMHIIDFDDLEEGSELWLFAQKTDLGEEMDNLIVLLTPEGKKASLWYEIIHSKNQLIVHGDKDVKFSYRLSAPRYDWRDHPVLIDPSD